jgi:hypothetical protein|nr:MAG TPA: hypothetical protein [Caudoviricetes sp.]
MSKVKAVFKYIAITLLILIVAQVARQIGAAAARPVDNPPRHVQEERTIKQARVDVYHHSEVNTYCGPVDGQVTCHEEVDTVNDNGWCKQYGCED